MVLLLIVAVLSFDTKIALLELSFKVLLLMVRRPRSTRTGLKPFVMVSLLSVRLPAESVT